MVRIIAWGVILSVCIGFAQDATADGRDESRPYQDHSLASEIQWQSVKDAASVEGKTYTRKDRGAAFRRSILLPGWGQITTGRETRGYFFMGAEVALIAG